MGRTAEACARCGAAGGDKRAAQGGEGGRATASTAKMQARTHGTLAALASPSKAIVAALPSPFLLFRSALPHRQQRTDVEVGHGGGGQAREAEDHCDAHDAGGGSALLAGDAQSKSAAPFTGALRWEQGQGVRAAEGESLKQQRERRERAGALRVWSGNITSAGRGEASEKRNAKREREREREIGGKARRWLCSRQATERKARKAATSAEGKWCAAEKMARRKGGQAGAGRGKFQAEAEMRRRRCAWGNVELRQASKAAARRATAACAWRLRNKGEGRLARVAWRLAMHECKRKIEILRLPPRRFFLSSLSGKSARRRGGHWRRGETGSAARWSAEDEAAEAGGGASACG